jgi:hypothetical protein
VDPLAGDRLPEHASERRTRRALLAWEGVLVATILAGAGAFLVGFGALAVFLAPIGLLVTVRRVRAHRKRLTAARAFVAAQHAQAAVEAGRFDEAETLLERVPPGAPEGARRGASLLTAVIALRRGDLVLARARASQIIADKAHDALGGVQHATARAIRALALAAADERDLARADIDAVVASPYAFREARLFSGLAWGVLLERAGERAALRGHLEQYRSELLRGAGAHERRLLRAWARMLELPSHSVYREAPEIAAEAEAAFVKALSPEAARFADEPARDALATERVLGTTSGEASPKKRANRTRALWIALASAPVLVGGAVLFVRMLFGVSGGASDGPHVDLGAVVGFGLLGALSLVIVALVVLGNRSARARADAETLFQAFRLLGQGHLPEARSLAANVSGSKQPHLVAQAELLLAQGALEDLAPALALEHADRGLAKLSGPALRELVADTVLAELVAARAFALAALDRHEAAHDALRELPSNAFALRQRFSVELVVAVRSGDDDRARELATAAPPGLGPLDDLVVDLVRAVASRGAIGLAEMLRLRRDASRAGERRYLRAFVPTLLEAFEHLDEIDLSAPLEGSIRVAEEATSDSATDLEQELEAIAEDEAGGGPKNGRRVA